MKRILLLFLCLFSLIMFSCANAEGEFPELNENGFLDEGEFVYEDADSGVWRYCSTTLKVEIIRYTDTSPKELWYEAEIWSADGELFDVIAADPEKRMKTLAYPYMTARNNDTVFAITADFAHLRIKNKARTGIIIRDGEIYGTKTYQQNKKNVFPNLDTLALFPDGSMQVHYSNELTAEEYLEMGATDVLAFGPLMIRDGELNTVALKRYATTRQPRAAIGMIEPHHYLAVLVEGRNSSSKGVSVAWVAEKMLARGCTLALNLDGGQSAGIIFMGRQLNTILNSYKRKCSCRKSAEIIGIGTSAQVAAPEDPF